MTNVTELVDATVANTVGASRRTDPDTSYDAALLNSVGSGTQRARVLQRLAEVDNANDYELGEAVGVLRTSAGKRRKELVALGLAVLTDVKRPTDTGAKAQVHEITDLGRAVALQL